MVVQLFSLPVDLLPSQPSVSLMKILQGVHGHDVPEGFDEKYSRR
jgi:hypothetical protein